MKYYSNLKTSKCPYINFIYKFTVRNLTAIQRPYIYVELLADSNVYGVADGNL